MNESKRTLLLRVGQAQVDALFERQRTGPILDDAEFLPLVEAVLTAFEGVEARLAEELWEYTFAVYDRMCQEAAPQYSTAENRKLMQSYLRRKR